MGAAFSVEITDKAVKELEQLSKKMQKRIVSVLEKLCDDPRPAGCEKLQQNPAFYRVRCGDYRIVYLVEAKTRCIVVALVRHRKDAYRGIEKLDPAVIVQLAAPLLVAISAHGGVAN